MFVEDWKNVIETEDAEIHVMGDMNMDLYHWRQRGGKPREWQPLVDLLFKEIISRNIVQTVDTTTRTQAGVDSILDHHYTNNTAFIKSTTVEPLVNSDHCYVQVNRTGRKQYTEDPNVKRRNWSKIDWGFLEDKLKSIDMSRIYHTRDVNEVTERVTAASQSVLDLQAPVKMQPNRKNYCPYFDFELKILVAEKKISYRQYQRDKTPANWLKFKTARNKVNKQMRKKRKGHIKAKIGDAEKDSQKLWNFSKHLLEWHSKTGVNKIEINGNLTKNEQDIANGFNSFFIKKIKDIDAKIEETDKNPLDYTRDYLNKFQRHGFEIPTFELRRVTCKDIKKVIGSLNNTKSTGFTDISMHAVKKLQHVITLVEEDSDT